MTKKELYGKLVGNERIIKQLRVLESNVNGIRFCNEQVRDYVKRIENAMDTYIKEPRGILDTYMYDWSKEALNWLEQSDWDIMIVGNECASYRKAMEAILEGEENEE